MNKCFKVLILASHPIQYQCPFFKSFAKHSEVDLNVIYCSDFGLKEYKDKEFGERIKWDIPLLEGYKSKFLPNLSLSPGLSNFIGLINPSIITELISGQYDVLWIHGWNNITNWLAMLTAFSLGIPVLLRAETNLLPKGNLLKNFIRKLIFKNLFKNIAGFLAIGKYNTEFYRSYGIPEEKIFLVPYTVDNNFFISKAQELISRKKELRRKYKMSEELPIILFSGKLIAKKQPLELLKAFEIVSKDVESSLVFLGDGGLRNEMEAYIKNHDLKNVYLTGFKNQTELPEFYAMSDIFVLPSLFEPWGLVVNEAMCFGLPVIISNKVGAGGDLIKGGVNGYAFEAANISELASYLKDLLQDETKRVQFGQCSRELIEKWSYKEDILGIVKYLKNCN